MVCTQLLLHGLKLPVMDGIIVMYPPTLAVLVCVFVATEYGDMMASGKHRILLKHPGLFLSATLLGICVNALSVALVGGGGVLSCVTNICRKSHRSVTPPRTRPVTIKVRQIFVMTNVENVWKRKRRRGQRK